MKFFWLGLLILVLGSGCGGGKKTPLSSDLDTIDVPDDSEFSEPTVDLIVGLPTPLEVVQLLKKAGARYEDNLLNADTKLIKYQTVTDQALNMGVYSADMAYANVFEKRQEAFKYFTATRRLAEGLSVGGVFNKDLVNRVTRAQDNQDSLEVLFTETFTNLHNELSKNKREKVLIYVFVGGWIESVFIASQIWKLNPTDQVAYRIADQQNSLKTLLSMLEPHKSEPGIDKVFSELKGLLPIFAKFKPLEIKPLEKETKDPKSKQAPDPDDEPETFYDFAKQDMEALHKKLKELRQFVIR